MVSVNNDNDGVSEKKVTATVSKHLSRQNATDKADDGADTDPRLSLWPSASTIHDAHQETLLPSSHLPLPLEDVYVVHPIVCRSSFGGVINHNHTSNPGDHVSAGAVAPGAAETPAVPSTSLVEGHTKDQDQGQDQNKDIDEVKASRVVLSQKRKELRQATYRPAPVDAIATRRTEVTTDTVNDNVTLGSDGASDIIVASSIHTLLANTSIDIDALADLRIRAKPGATSLASHFANVQGYQPLHHRLDNDNNHDVNDDNHHHHNDQQDLTLSPSLGHGLGLGLDCGEGSDGGPNSVHREVNNNRSRGNDGDGNGQGQGHSFVSARHICGNNHGGGHDDGSNGGGIVVGAGEGIVHPATPRNPSRPSSFLFTDVGARHQGGNVVVVAGKGMVLGTITTHNATTQINNTTQHFINTPN